jgi:hypothetical protein
MEKTQDKLKRTKLHWNFSCSKLFLKSRFRLLIWDRKEVDETGNYFPLKSAFRRDFVQRGALQIMNFIMRIAKTTFASHKRVPVVQYMVLVGGILVFSNGRLGASYRCSDSMFGLAPVSVSVMTLGLVTLNFQANTHPPLVTSPHPLSRPPDLLCDFT